MPDKQQGRQTEIRQGDAEKGQGNARIYFCNK